VQTTIANSGSVSAISPKQQIASDLDYLIARLHARRSRMAEAERLDALCRIRSLPEFFQTIFPESELKGLIDFQRLLINKLIRELYSFYAYMKGPGADFLYWSLVRFQVENLKVLIRTCFTKTPFEEVNEHLISLPKEFVLNTQRLAKAESPEDFVRLIPKGLLQENMEKALKIYHEYPQSFFFEVSMDCGYFKGLVVKTEELLGEDREIVRPMVYQEADIFNLMLIARGKFYYGLTPTILRPFYVSGTQIPRTLFTAMLNDVDLSTAVNRIAERVLDVELFKYGPKEGSNFIDASILESLAWKRFFRLANLAFRQSHMGFAAIIGYMGLRRVEVANIITISEGIHNGMTGETIRGRLIPQTNIGGGLCLE
jgi:V/A-type H+-transporting ATPase subunit C